MPPVVIAGGIAAAGAIGGSLLANSAQKKANNQAAQTQNNATNAQLQLGRESMGLNREIYDKNTALLNPYVQRGNVAGDSINALLGLPSTPAAAEPRAQSSARPAPQPPSASPASPMPGAIPAQPGQQNAMASPQGAITGPAMNALSGTPATASPVPAAPYARHNRNPALERIRRVQQLRQFGGDAVPARPGRGHDQQPLRRKGERWNPARR
jgi:hypothetical protein